MCNTPSASRPPAAAPVRQPLDVNKAFHDCVPGVLRRDGELRSADQPGHPGQQHSSDRLISHSLYPLCDSALCVQLRL